MSKTTLLYIYAATSAYPHSGGRCAEGAGHWLKDLAKKLLWA